MSKKEIQKEVSISTDVDTYKDNKMEIDAQIKDGESVNLTSTNEGDIKETLKLPLRDVLSDLGISLENQPPEVAVKIKGIVKKMMNHLQQNYGVGAMISEGDDDFQDPDLFDQDEERAEREMNEDFDSLMESLNSKGGPVVKISENVNPRITKQDLIKFIKNKK